MAIEINDTSSSPDSTDISETGTGDADGNDDDEDDGLLPISPLDADVSQGCLQRGQIKGVQLSDLFNWHSIVFSKLHRHRHTRLFRKAGGGCGDAHSPPSPPPVPPKSPSSTQGCKEASGGIERILPREADHQESEEVGVDVVAEMDNEQQQKPSQSLLMSLLRHSSASIIENTTPGAHPNPLYPLAPWQPDVLIAATQITQPSPPGTDSEGLEEDEEDTESRRRFGGKWTTAARVGRECVRCKARFSLIKRRHHCRRCGHIFCASCCSEKAPVEALSTMAGREALVPPTGARVCVECAEFVRSGFGEALERAVLTL